MKKIIAFLDQLMEWACFISIAGFTFLIFLQVVFRYVFKSPLNWQEEVSLYLFYIVIMMGAVMAIRNSAHISVDFITMRMSEQNRLLLKVVISILVFVCCLYITYSGYLYCTSVGARRSGELRILMKYVYALFPVSGTLMCIYTVRGIWEAGMEYYRKKVGK